MKEVLAEAFEYTCNHMHEYWISHYPGYLRTFIAIIIFGVVGTIAGEIYDVVYHIKWRCFCIESGIGVTLFDVNSSN